MRLSPGRTRRAVRRLATAKLADPGLNRSFILFFNSPATIPA
jgi:hypothetical protein